MKMTNRRKKQMTENALNDLRNLMRELNASIVLRETWSGLLMKRMNSMMLQYRWPNLMPENRAYQKTE